jgi:RHS repeat-associated protein
MGTVRYTVIDGEVMSELRNGVKRDYVPDPLGSTVALLDATQTKTDTFQYWPYGESAGRTGTTATPFQYVGSFGYYQDGAAKNYIRARYLDKGKGRWLTEDNMMDGRNWQIYTYNSPTSKIDPTGYLTIIGCGKKLGTMQDAFRNLCSRKDKYNSCICPSEDDNNESAGACGGMSHPNCFNDYCDTTNLTIYCENCGTRDNRYICGASKPGHTNSFIFCNAAFNFDDCGGIHCTIAHEMVHTCGKFGHKPQGCFDCIDAVFPSCKGKVVDR